MRFSELLASLHLKGEKNRLARAALWARTGLGRVGTAQPWYDSETAMKKYRRYRAVRNAMAYSSRKRNRPDGH